MMLSKCITDARLDYNATQLNILACIIKQLQEYMSTDGNKIQSFIHNECGSIGWWVTINRKEVSTKRGNVVEDSIEAMKQIGVDFRLRTWRNPRTNEVYNNVDVHQQIIDQIVTHDSDKSKVEVCISVNALPFLLYYGKGVGGNLIDYYHVTKTLKSKYAKMLYAKICGYINKGIYLYYIDELCRNWSISDASRRANRHTEYIRKAIDEINSNNVGITIDMKTILKCEGQGRPKVIAYEMTINSDSNNNSNTEDLHKQYRTIYNIVTKIMGANNNTIQIVDRIIDKDKGQLLIGKCQYYNDLKMRSQINQAQYNGAIRTIIDREYIKENKA